MIHKYTVTVYEGDGRRWFSLRSAAHAEAKRALRDRCDCYYEMDTGACQTCKYHAMPPARWLRIRDTLARFIIANYKRRTKSCDHKI